MSSGDYPTEANPIEINRPLQTALSKITSGSWPEHLRFSKQRPKVLPPQQLISPLTWNTPKTSPATPKHTKILSFDLLSKEWRDKHIPTTDNTSLVAALDQRSKRLPDSVSTVDPSESQSSKMKLCDLEIKSIVSLEDEEDSALN